MYARGVGGQPQESSRFDREAIRAKIAALPDKGVYIGTSSWKYPGWRGLLYDEARYLYRGKVAESRFEKQCLPDAALPSETAPTASP